MTALDLALGLRMARGDYLPGDLEAQIARFSSIMGQFGAMIGFSVAAAKLWSLMKCRLNQSMQHRR